MNIGKNRKTEMKNYGNIPVKELLDDDYFIQSHKHPTPESIVFWNERLQSGELDRKVYERACFLLDALSVKKEQVSLSKQEELWERIVQTNQRAKRIRRFRLQFVVASAAASLLIILWLNIGKISFNETVEESLYSLAQVEVPVNSDEIKLILQQQSIAIKGKNSIVQYDSIGNVVVNSEKVQDFEEESEHNFNQLIVPNGKRSTLALEDGTKMWINAGSRVIYPRKFEKNKRMIYVDGEVYMEVSHEENRPFIVKTNMMDVEVLGTSFNVTAYKKDVQSSVVLVTGSVRVTAKDEQVQIVPNERYSYSPQNGGQVKEVNSSDYISWKEGIYVYHSEPLSSILNRLSRYYGKDILYNQDVGQFKCSGKLDLQDDLDSLLEGLTHTLPVYCTKQGEKYVFSKK